MTRTASLLFLGAIVSLAIAIPFATVFGESGDNSSETVEKEALALTTAFTYQGRLTDGGALADAAYDMRFILWNASAGGAQVGSTITLPAVAVSKGFFTVSLDFGGPAFNGEARWLEIAIKLPAQATYTVLNPRQPITAVPYALYALNGTGGLTLPASASANSAAPTPGLAISQTGSGDGVAVSRAPATPAAGYAFTASNSGAGAAIKATGGVALEIDGAIKATGTAPAFVHAVTAGNKCESDKATIIDNPLTNGDSNAVVVVTYRGTGTGLAARPATGVMYDGGASLACTDGRWVIFTLDGSALSTGGEFNVLVVQR